MAKYTTYGSYGGRFGGFYEGGIAVEVSQTVRQRPLFVSASMLIPPAFAPSPEQKAGYSRLIVYAGTLAADTHDVANMQAERVDWTYLGVDRILMNRVFPINNGIDLVFPIIKLPSYGALENQALGALLVCPCDQLGVVMEGLGSLTFFGAVDDATDSPQYKAI